MPVDMTDRAGRFSLWQVACFDPLSIIAAGASILGTGASVVGGIAAGQQAKSDADFQAMQLERKANEEKAAAQREASDKRQEGLLVQSRQQALAAASGGGAGTDAPTIAKIMSDTAGKTEYNANSVMYGGNERAAGFLDQAAATRASGKAAYQGSLLGAFGSAASGIGGMFNPRTGIFGGKNNTAWDY